MNLVIVSAIIVFFFIVKKYIDSFIKPQRKSLQTPNKEQPTDLHNGYSFIYPFAVNDIPKLKEFYTQLISDILTPTNKEPLDELLCSEEEEELLFSPIELTPTIVFQLGCYNSILNFLNTASFN